MKLWGIAASEGVGMGPVVLVEAFMPTVSQQKLKSGEVKQELEKYKAVQQKCCQDLMNLFKEMQRFHPDKAKIFTAHMDILCDEELEKEIHAHIQEQLVGADWAVTQIYNRYHSILQQSKSRISQERADDFLDVRNRILREWQQVPAQDLSCLPQPVVIIAKDLLPSDTATLDHSKVLAIATEAGGLTSHTSILARGYGIPAVLGVKGLTRHLQQGQTVVVNGLEGFVETGPFSEEQMQAHQKIQQLETEKKRSHQQYVQHPCQTQDGKSIGIGLNLIQEVEQEAQHKNNVDFVGLFRTEFLYMQSDTLPTEQVQYLQYKKLAQQFGTKPVYLRTLDIGGDKPLPALNMEKEENPFLGKRALRLCFEHPHMFKTQLRAALRASAFGDIQLMFPMVSSLEEVKKAKGFLAQAMEELEKEGQAFNKDIPVGVMIEIPSIGLMAPELAKEVDFASLGTNDLCQYILAVDRGNPALSSYYQNYHPAVFRLIQMVSSAFNNAGKPISICGELAGQSLAVPLLVGLGVTKLSMAHSRIGAIKALLSNFTMADMQAIAAQVLKCESQQDVLKYLENKITPLR